MSVKERTLSEFLLHSGRVLPELEYGEVLLHRSDGEDLVLMTRRQSEALRATAQAFFALSTGDQHAVEVALPWIAFLSPSGRDECIRELREVGAASLQGGHLSRLAETLYAWEATALAAWDERRNRERLGHAAEEPVEVQRPGR
ncbi:MAG TPA: hypothetical protein VNL16_08135 [Chloroflexota bacterium]|nr:hypothetical protein [Chloroflexota bacterium]